VAANQRLQLTGDEPRQLSHNDIKFLKNGLNRAQKMESIKNLKSLSDEVREMHKNFVVCEVNDSCLRLAVNEGEFPWHYHSNSDELFIVLEGELSVEFHDKPAVTLKPQDTFLVTKGIIHKTIAKGRTVNLCFEKAESDTIFIE
jgi:mannose-6-phosphate isomerase-like protein (cupin superfamily)